MISVRIFHSLLELAPLRGELDRLNRESKRASPFTTLAYSEACLASDPELRRDCVPWVCVAFEGQQPVGYLALRCVPERSAGFSAHRLEHLPTCGVDRPHLVAAPADEARAAEAIVQHLSEAPGWLWLKLNQQDAESELRGPIQAIAAQRHYVRELEDRQTTTLPIVWKTLADYVAILPGKHRSHVKRMTLDTLKTGAMSSARSSNPEALPALLDLYLSIEKRSWKGSGDASMGGSPWREPLMRWILAHREPMTPTIELLLDGDKPICGTITGDYESRVYFLYTAFDSDYSAVSPGAPMLLFAIERAILGGFEAFNMLPDYAYYKRRWLGVVTETKTIQVYRRLSAPYLKARLGDLRRRLAGEGERAMSLFNPERRAVAGVAAKTTDQRETESGPVTSGPRCEASASDRALVAQLRATEGVLWRTSQEMLAATPFAHAQRHVERATKAPSDGTQPASLSAPTGS